MDGIDPAPGPAPVGSMVAPAPGWSLSSIGTSGLTAACVVLLLLFLTGRFLWHYNKIAAAAAAAAQSAAAASSSSRPGSTTSLQLQLPVLVHVGADSAAACAVCLAELGHGQDGRALPRCGHGFHEECIASWLRVNTTCPLCRARVAPK